MKQQPRVEPQRYYRLNGQLGWHKCEPHQAACWAAVVGCHVIGRYGNKRIAMETLASYLIRKQKPARRYELGCRMVKKPESVGSYATSLTKEQYDAL